MSTWVTLLSLLVLVAIVPRPAAAQGIPGAQHPTLSYGLDGATVTAWQYILRYRGHRTSAPNGVFDSATFSETQAFQAAEGLPQDGVVNVVDWNEGLPASAIHLGTTGDHVRAAEALLGSKHGFSVPITGYWSSGDGNALGDFKVDLGYSPNPVIGPITWRHLTFHYVPGLPVTYARCTDGTPVTWPHTSGGSGMMDPWTTEEVEADYIEWYTDWFNLQAYWGVIWGAITTTDANLAHGGDIAGHDSHEVGMDVDVRPISNNGDQCTDEVEIGGSYSQTRTDWLVHYLEEAATYNGTMPYPYLEVVYFNDGYLQSQYSFVEYWPGHDDHLHIRWCSADGPSSAYTCG